MSAFARENAKAQMLRAEFIADLIVAFILKVPCSSCTLVGRLGSHTARRALAN